MFADGVTIVDTAGEAVGTRTRLSSAATGTPTRRSCPYRLIDGRGPVADGEVALDSVSAEKSGYAVGDPCG